MKRMNYGLGHLDLGDNTLQDVTAGGAAETEEAFLDEKAARIAQHLRGEATSAILQQIAAGREVVVVRADGRYGEAAVRKLASKAKVSAKLLYRLGAMAEMFCDELVQWAVGFANEKLYRLTPSVFDELTGIDEEDKRFEFLERSISNHWTIKELRAEVRGTPAARTASRRVRSGFDQVIADAEKLKSALCKLVEEGNTTAWCNEEGVRAFIAIAGLAEVIVSVTKQWAADVKAVIEAAPASEPQDEGGE